MTDAAVGMSGDAAQQASSDGMDDAQQHNSLMNSGAGSHGAVKRKGSTSAAPSDFDGPDANTDAHSSLSAAGAAESTNASGQRTKKARTSAADHNTISESGASSAQAGTKRGRSARGLSAKASGASEPGHDAADSTVVPMESDDQRREAASANSGMDIPAPPKRAAKTRGAAAKQVKLDEDQAAGAPSDASGSVGVASSHHGPGANVSGHKDPTAVDPDSKSPHWKPPHGRVIRDQHPFLDQIKQDKKETKGSLECVFLNYSNTLETAERLIRGYVNQVISCV